MPLPGLFERPGHQQVDPKPVSAMSTGRITVQETEQLQYNAESKLMHNRNYLPLSIIIATFYWFFDSFLYWIAHAQDTFSFFPPDIYGLWTKTFIYVLIICFGMYANHASKKIIAAQEEKRQILNTTANESQKILKEFLHKVRYFESEAEIIGGFDQKCLRYLEDALRSAEGRLHQLNNVGEITTENIIRSVQKTGDRPPIFTITNREKLV